MPWQPAKPQAPLAPPSISESRIPPEVVAASVRLQLAGGGGSGTVVHVDEAKGAGFILTNKHVIALGRTAKVTFPSGVVVEGEVIAGDATQADLGAIAIPADALTPRVAIRSTYPPKGTPICQVGYGGGKMQQRVGQILGYRDEQPYQLMLSFDVIPGDSGSGVFVGKELAGVVWGGPDYTGSGRFEPQAVTLVSVHRFVKACLPRLFRPRGWRPQPGNPGQPSPGGPPIIDVPPGQAPPPAGGLLPFGELRDKLGQLDGKLKEFDAKLGGLADSLNKELDAKTRQIADAVKKAGDNIEGKIAGRIDQVEGRLGGLPNAIQGPLGQLDGKLKDQLGGLKEKLDKLPVDKIPALVDAVAGLASWAPIILGGAATGGTLPLILGGLALWRRARAGQRIVETVTVPGPTQVVERTVVRENPPPPQVIERESKYVPVRTHDPKLAALHLAMDDIAQKHPGARETIETLKAFAAQYESGQRK